jgi:hypothetical protein
MAEPAASEAQKAALFGAVEQHLGDSEADHLGVRDPGLAPGSGGIPPGQEIVSEDIKCCEKVVEVVEVGEHEATSGGRLLAVQQKAGPIALQRGRVPARVVDRQPERNLPAQVPRHRLHRLLVRAARPVLQQQHLGQPRRRDRGTADAVGVAVGEVLVAHDPLAVLGQQSEERALQQRPDQLGRVENPTWPDVVESVLGKIPTRPDETRPFSAVS